MRYTIRAIALALCLAVPVSIGVSGCETLNAILHPSDTQAQIIAEKGLVAAHELHAAAAISASAAANSGACISTCAVTVKDYLNRSYALLLEADDVSDATTINAKVSEAIGLINKAKELF